MTRPRTGLPGRCCGLLLLAGGLLLPGCHQDSGRLLIFESLQQATRWDDCHDGGSDGCPRPRANYDDYRREREEVLGSQSSTTDGPR